MDISILCRCCMEELSQEELNFSNQLILDMFLYCAQVRDEDFMPKNFCSNCCYQIKLMHTFIKEAQANSKTLQEKIYQSTIIKNDDFESENYSSECDNKSEIILNYVDCNDNSTFDDTVDSKANIDDNHLEGSEMVIEENSDLFPSKTQENFKQRKIFKRRKRIIQLNLNAAKKNAERKKRKLKLKTKDNNVEVIKIIDNSTEKEEIQYSLQNTNLSEINNTELESSNNDNKNNIVNSEHFETTKTEHLHLPEIISNGIIQENTTCTTSKSTKNSSHELTKSNSKLACPACDKIYSQYRFLEIHFKKKHSEHTNTTPNRNAMCEEKPFACHVCEKRFRLRKGLAVHALTHSDERPFICDRCQMAFKMKQVLLKHMRTHEQECSYLCHICAKGFKNEHNLREHMAVHTGAKSYSCAACGYRAAYRSCLRRHQARHAARAHHCPHCQKPFYERTALNRHIRIHTGQKPFKCPSCPLAFIDHWKRKTHLMRVHQVPFAEIPRLAADGQPIAKW